MQASLERLWYDAAATARNVSWNALGGHAALANEFVALSVQARPQLPARQRKAGTAI